MKISARPDLKPKVPLFASLISIGYGLTGLYGLFEVATVHHPKLFNDLVGQSSAYITLDVLCFVCMVIGSAFLWKMDKRTFPFFVASWIFSKAAKFFYHSPSGHTSTSLVLAVFLIAVAELFGLAVLAHIWYITGRWNREASAQVHTLEA